MSELEAWAIVRKAIGRSNYYAEEEFEKLPEACKMAVGNPSNLREWAMMDSDQVGTVEQSHFVRNYRTAMQRIKEDRRMPEKVRAAIAEVKKQQMQIEDRQEKPKLPVQEEKEDETQGEMSEETRRKLEVEGGRTMAFKKVAEISIDKLEDRKTVTAILHANGYTVGPGKRKKTPTGKQLDYYLKVYKEVEEDGKDE